MSKKHNHQNAQPESVIDLALKAVDAVYKAALPAEIAEPFSAALRRLANQISPPARTVKKHLQCPACFNGYGGTGKRKWWRQISGPLRQIAYRCDQCGCEWTAEVRTGEEAGVEFVETKVVQVRKP